MIIDKAKLNGLMRQCQRGVPGTGRAIEAANNLLALCYSSIEPLISENARLSGADKAYAEVWEKARALQAEMDEVVAERDQLKAENDALRKDAERWRAFISCARIRFFGWAGYSEKDPNGNSPGNYRHFGGEFWTIHSAQTADKEKAAEILNGFADAAIAAMDKGAQHG